MALDSLWTRVAYSKYIALAHVVDWIRRSASPFTGISIIWKTVLKALEPIHAGITWRIHSGDSVRIGIDLWIVCGDMHRLPPELLALLKEKNITHLAHIADEHNSSFLQHAWKSVGQLNIPPL